MENKPNEVKLSTGPLALERTNKLKIYTILGKHKDIDAEFLKDKMTLAIIAAYSDIEAVSSAKQAANQLGFPPDEFKIPYMMVSMNAEEIIQIKPEPPRYSSSQNIAPFPLNMQPGKIEIVEKSKEDIVTYLRLVFDKVGTKADKVVMEKVITKFLKSDDKK